MSPTSPRRAHGRRSAQSMSELRKLAPRAGAYVSESDFFQPNWRESFWGGITRSCSRSRTNTIPKGFSSSITGSAANAGAPTASRDSIEVTRNLYTIKLNSNSWPFQFFLFIYLCPSCLLSVSNCFRAAACRLDYELSDIPVATLEDGRAGTIAFAALTQEFARTCSAATLAKNRCRRRADPYPNPSTPTGAPKTKVPARHDCCSTASSGVLQNGWDWAKRLNDLGYATFVIDNFTGRGVI